MWCSDNPGLTKVIHNFKKIKDKENFLIKKIFLSHHKLVLKGKHIFFTFPLKLSSYQIAYYLSYVSLVFLLH